MRDLESFRYHVVFNFIDQTRICTCLSGPKSSLGSSIPSSTILRHSARMVVLLHDCVINVIKLSLVAGGRNLCGRSAFLMLNLNITEALLLEKIKIHI